MSKIMRSDEQRQEALRRAQSGESLANLPAIYAGFQEKGIPEDEIRPRINVLTYDAWKAAGRQVRKGEHGVRISTVINMNKQEEDGATKSFTRPRATTVFHISQTDPLAS